MQEALENAAECERARRVRTEATSYLDRALPRSLARATAAFARISFAAMRFAVADREFR